MDKAKIQSAGAQYALGYSTMAAPMPQRPSLTKGERKADGYCLDFYEEGWEDAARGTRANLRQYAPTFIGRHPNGAPKLNEDGSVPEEVKEELEILGAFRDAVGTQQQGGSDLVIGAVGRAVEALVRAFDEHDSEQRALARVKAREEAAAKKAADEAAAKAKAEAEAKEQAEFEEFKRQKAARESSTG